jgi:Flp pilus assembly protein TadG
MVNMRTMASVSKRLRQFGAAARGVAGVEFAIIGPLLAIGLLNAVDVGYDACTLMEVENAAEIGAQAAWNNCNDVPLTIKVPPICRQPKIVRC